MFTILHLFRISGFTEDFINFINNNFVDNIHEFWVYGDRNISNIHIKMSSYRNAKYIHNIADKIKLSKLDEYDKIIYHGVFEQEIIDAFFWNRKLLKKLYLRIWGGDKFLYGNNFDKFRKKIVFQNAHAVIYIIPEEKLFMKRHYCIKGKQFCAFYDLNGIINKCAATKNNMPKMEKEYFSVQIGNSATPTNNHILIMKKLLKFKDENIKIFVPLSYGDKSYADRVIKTGKDFFGDKFVGITDFMDIDSYNVFMNQIDVALFGIKRQQALGNIMALLYFGKKVYLRENSIVEHYFKQRCHCNVQLIEKIDEMDFNEFIRFGQEEALYNEKYMGEMACLESVINPWNTIFNESL